MSRVFITGSTEGLGLMAAQLLLDSGHDVILHARNESRARDVASRVPKARATTIGDLSSISQTRDLAAQVNRLGPFDAIIHNASVGPDESERKETEDRLPHVFAVNVLAPYILTSLVQRPSRLVYLTSGMHRGADPCLLDVTWSKRTWNGEAAYSESKLYVAMLAFAVARRWRGVCSNAVEPGWVPTRMGGPNATDNLDQGHRTQVWLATSNETAALVTGQYFYHFGSLLADPAAYDAARSEELLQLCRRLSGIEFPE